MNHTMFAARRVLPLLTLTLFACSDIDGPRSLRRPAVLAINGSPPYVTTPATVRVGEPVTVVAISFSGGCTKRGETEVVVSGAVAEVRPYRYDLVDLPPNTACISILRMDSNVAVVTFSLPGTDTVRVIGVRQPGEAPLAVERLLTVSP